MHRNPYRNRIRYLVLSMGIDKLHKIKNVTTEYGR